MPPFKRKGKDDYNNYHHKDERSSDNFYSKRVSFQTQSNQLGWVNKIIEKCIGHGGNTNTPANDRKRPAIRYNPMQPRRGGYRDSSNNFSFKGRVLQESPFSWYKVVLCNGRKYSRIEILKALENFIDSVNFAPVAVKLEDDDLTFFIDNYKTASAICGANLRLSMRDGWKIQIKVSAHMPFVDVNPALKEKIIQVMSSHYDAKTQHLDLSKFYAKEEFQADGIFAPLNCQNVFRTVLEIIGESVPNVVSIDLSNNKIISTEHLSILKKFANHLKSLNLSQNKINNLRDLSCLQGIKIETLALENNPLCDKFEDQTNYVREVRKIFKVVMLLDGIALPAPVSFDEENQSEIPKSLGSFLCNEDGRGFTQQFLEQYYAIYDNRQSRDALHEAYANAAQFSMNVFNISGSTSQKYVFHSRNLKRITKFEQRTHLLHIGKDEIVRFLNTLPKTQHDVPNFTVDLSIFTPRLVSLCVCGVFQEVGCAAPIKAFSRTFVLTPVGSGYNIINDMLTITDASKEVTMSALKSPILALVAHPQPLELNVKSEIAPYSTKQTRTLTIGETNMLNTTPVSGCISGSTPRQSPPEYELDNKRELVTALSMQTGMNLTWSEKCLVDTDWVFDNALYAFNKFHKSNQIPPEAFIK